MVTWCDTMSAGRNLMLCGVLALPSACGQEASQPEKPAQSQPGKPAQTTPAETKPADVKPPEANSPAESPTGDLGGQAVLPTMKVELAGRAFNLEVANTDETRYRGLSGRTRVDPDSGMIFVFRDPHSLNFVMRDCVIDIDILYVDATGRITAMYHMKKEEPRRADEPIEKQVLLPDWAQHSPRYENRLKKYPSRFDAVIAIELKAGTLNINGSNPEGLKLKAGDKLDLDVAALRRKVK